MIFTPDQAKAILQGRKTQTRRPVKRDELRCRYRAGHAYSVQPGRRHATFPITILHVDREPLSTITHDDAKREGHRTVAAFLEEWQTHHPHGADDAPVWVISFRPGDLTDTPNLLHAAWSPQSGDYTSSTALSMRDEGEALDLVQLAELTRPARQRELTAPHRQMTDPLDEMRNALEAMQRTLTASPNRQVHKALTRVEHHVNALARQLAQP